MDEGTSQNDRRMPKHSYLENKFTQQNTNTANTNTSVPPDRMNRINEYRHAKHHTLSNQPGSYQPFSGLDSYKKFIVAPSNILEISTLSYN